MNKAVHQRQLLILLLITLSTLWLRSTDTTRNMSVKEEPAATRPQRERKPTDKGAQYAHEVQSKAVQRAYRGLQKQTDVFKELIRGETDSQTDLKAMQEHHRQWMTLYEEFLGEHKKLCALLTPDERKTYDEWFAERDKLMRDYQWVFKDWFARQTIPVPPVPLQKSVRSVRSAGSARSFAESVASAKLNSATKKAELETRMRSLKAKQELDQAKLQLKMEEEELELKIEVAVEEAKSNILNQFDRIDEDNGSLVLPSTSRPDPLLNPEAKPFSPQRFPSVTQRQDDVFNNSNIPCGHSGVEVSAMIREMKKPQKEIHKFNGDPMKYRAFLRQFNTYIMPMTESSDERLTYLEQFTEGEAKRIVKGYMPLRGDVGYPAALEELERRYGDAETITNAYITKALNWPVIKNDDPKGLDELAIFLTECQYAVQDLEAIKILEYAENLKRIIKKLPIFLHDKWRNIVLNTRDKGHVVNFGQLVEFIRREARKATDPTYGRDAISQKSFQKTQYDQGGRTTRSFATNVTDGSEQTKEQTKESVNKGGAFKKPCLYCMNIVNGKNHSLHVCRKLKGLDFRDRIEFLKGKGLCWGCLKYGHHKKDCYGKATCQECQGRHPTVLHFNKVVRQRDDHESESVNKNTPESSTNETACNIVSCSYMGAGDKGSMMAVIPVNVRAKNGIKSVQTYAFLDPGSNVSFCTDELTRQLGVEGKHIKITMDTMGVKHKMNTQVVSGLEVCDLQFDAAVELPCVYTKARMPISKKHIPTQDDLSKWPHLADVTLPQIDAEVGLLIGNNIPDAYTPLEVKTGPRGSPHAVRSLLGWIPWNILNDQSSIGLHVNRAEVSVSQVEELQQLNRLVVKAMQMDFPEKEIDERKEHSQEDKVFLKKTEETCVFKNGHYEINLPFRDDNPQMLNNEDQALHRLRTLEKKMKGNPTFCEDYKVFMASIIDKGYAEQVPQDKLQGSPGRLWYLPHHGVYHSRKGKLRVVFDCSAKYRGIALNDVLLSGPNLTNSLVGVLMRFRLERFAISADIESMFYQVMVPEDDRDFLRFFWWPDGNFDLSPEVYRMTVHLFGAISSPSCANFALQKTANDNSSNHDADVQDSVKRDFYVDDFLKSEATIDQAISCVQNVTKLCESGGFRLTKWIANDRAVLESVPSVERAKNWRELDLNHEVLPMERVLGVCWFAETDMLGFKIMISEVKPTRRNMLSIVCSVYDPLGLVSPFVLPARILLQELCKCEYDWDQQLSESYLQRWQLWMSELPRLQDFTLPRCYKPPNFGIVVSQQLHIFADASENGYGVVAYMRFQNDKDQIHCSLLMSSSRVAPIKKTTIPRLELTAATLAVRMYGKIQQELCLQFNEVHFWTDSMSVLRYIQNTKTRFRTFVANRVSVIRESSTAEQWHYIPSTLNPADLVSRGLTIEGLLGSNVWVHGPKFLCCDSTGWPNPPQCNSSDMSPDPEVISATTISMPDNDDMVEKLFAQYSSWWKLKKVVAWILRLKRNLRFWYNKRQEVRNNLEKEYSGANLDKMVDQQIQKLKRSNSCAANKMSLSLAEVKDAEMTILMYVQHKAFPEVYTPGHTKKTSSLYKLDPIVMDGILRVGGRLQNALVGFDAKHPIILPREAHITHLILQHVHVTTGHSGKNAMLAKLHENYWVVGAARLIKHIVRRCVPCRKYHASTCEQKMANLPSDRVNSDDPPFSHVGMDYFGPFLVKRGRAMVKRYGVIFTCLVVRAIHLEVASQLDTDSCINAIRRFTARRGPAKTIRSDNGTNLVGAERELREEIEKLNQSKINDVLHQDGIEWKLNPPSASHFGGVWERLIRSTRKILYSLGLEQNSRLDDEGLQTLFCEAEAILNSRPLTAASEETKDLNALTPNHLLIQREGQMCPVGIFDVTDNYVRRRWRQIQYLADQFWKRWSREYLSTLQIRQKWLKVQRNVAIGDIVLIMDAKPRNTWSLGRIVEVVPNAEGIVRMVHVKTSTNTLVRPIHKLCLLLEGDDM